MNAVEIKKKEKKNVFLTFFLHKSHLFNTIRKMYVT